MTQYIIQVGSWTKLPSGEVQEDTRDIMEMMAEKVGGRVEGHVARVCDLWHSLGVNNKLIVKVYDGADYKYQDLLNKQSLFIPYEELQKMLNKPTVQNVSSLLNTKLDCRKLDGTVDEELSRAFQEAVTGGYHNKYGGWSVNSYKQSVERFTSAPFLYVSENGMLCLGDYEEEDHFNRNSKTQINLKYSRTLTWEVVEITHVAEEDEMVDICGVEYSAKELSEALALIKSARKG